MSDSAGSRPLTGWQRARVLSAAQYMRETVARTPGDARARAVYEGLLDVLEPTRHAAREYRAQRHASGIHGSMWEQRAGPDRRFTDRRTVDVPRPAGRERRVAQRRSGGDRRAARG